MPSLLTAKDLELAWDPGFCFLCGKSWAAGDETDRDHLPNSSVFAKADRNPPLILRVHVRCNQLHSKEDEAFGQLVSMLHRPPTEPKHIGALQVSMYQVPGSAEPLATIEGLPLPKILARWVRGFHAALYRVPLLSYDGYAHPPFGGTDNLADIPPPDPIIAKFVEALKKNKAAKSVDLIESRNGRCRYVCCWTKLDDGRPICVWALDIYDWMRLGRTAYFPGHSCVGWYFAEGGVPPRASRATDLVFPYTNKNPLDAFGD